MDANKRFKPGLPGKVCQLSMFQSPIPLAHIQLHKVILTTTIETKEYGHMHDSKSHDYFSMKDEAMTTMGPLAYLLMVCKPRDSEDTPPPKFPKSIPMQFPIICVHRQSLHLALIHLTP